MGLAMASLMAFSASVLPRISSTFTSLCSFCSRGHACSASHSQQTSCQKSRAKQMAFGALTVLLCNTIDRLLQEADLQSAAT